MRRCCSRRYGLVFLGVLAGCMLPHAPARAFGTLDVAQTQTNARYTLSAPQQLIQTFIAHGSGSLDTITLDVGRGPSGGGDLLVAVYAIQNGQLAAQAMAGEIVPRSSVPGTLSSLDVTLSVPPDVSANSPYAIVLSSTGGDFLVAATTFDAFTQGTLYGRVSSTSALSPQPGDLYFIIYVSSSPGSRADVWIAPGRL